MRLPSPWLPVTLALCALAFQPAPLQAWSDKVHRAVLRVAQERLSPTADRRQRLMMGSDAKLYDNAGWSHHIEVERPETEAWHSITIPPTATRLDLDRDCPVGDCTPVKLRETVGIVRLAHKDKPQLQEAFKFLVNLAVDMHQPLRAGYPPGNGGDAIPVAFNGTEGELYEYWDNEIFADVDEDLLAERIRELITPQRAREWSKGNMKDWTWDTHLSAVRVAYGALPKGSPKQLDGDYAVQARMAAELQLAKAAVRLSTLLDEVWP
ncbi:MAG: hypothetical protein H6509_04280 [Bryobacterales bacterium]|nr:hypothetical protein [Acidobacteriota bacterium]MCB9383810.1 hypothetical protein [Bryobacterales bacterium]